MKVKKTDFTGTTKVFKFTLQQFLKSKTSVVMIIMMFITSAGSLVISSLSSNAGTLKETEITRLYIVNDTKYIIGAEEIAKVNGIYTGIDTEASSETLDKVRGRLDSEPYSAAANITLDNTTGAYMAAVYSGKESKLTGMEMSTLSSAIVSALSEARLKSMDATEEQLKTAMSQYSAELIKLDEYKNTEPELSTETFFTISFVYTFLLFMLIMYSTAYIIRSIIDEKTTSLVETLMVSIRPLALVVGKILASMCLMLLNFLMLALGLGLSYAVLDLLPDSVIQVGKMFDIMGLSTMLSNLNWFTCIIILISMLLGYISYSIIGGLSGTCCSSIEDAESANSTVLILSFFGYFGSIATIALKGKVASTILSLIPFLSMFTAPVRYTAGMISLVTLILAWLIQGAIAVLLFRFTAKVYESLLMYKGNKVKLKQLLLMAKTVKRGEGT